MRTGGSIVLVSSAAARIGLANHEAITAAKIGVIGLTPAAAAIAWVLDPARGWVTGQVLGIDGGLASVRVRGAA